MNRLSYEQKLSYARNPAAQRLLSLMLEKETNLCASLDVPTLAELLRIVEEIADQVCMVKTHADTLPDATLDGLLYLHELAVKRHISIFEDRKFADIGNTVAMQYRGGVHRIVEWSDITNAHIIPGPGVIAGLEQVGLPQGKGLLLLAEMSSEGSLAHGEYTRTAYAWARKHPDFVIGFIGKGNTDAPQELIMCTPGIHLEHSADALQQQYQLPQEAIAAGTDIVIVGRGIYAEVPGSGESRAERAARYRSIAWKAYQSA